MCRALIYLGRPIPLDNLLFRPESSLVNQALLPRKLQMLNLAGFGMMAWDSRSHHPEVPFRYATPSLPVFDRNLRALATKLTPECVIAHVRGVAYAPTSHVSEINTHPFCFDRCTIALAHNGDLYRIDDMKRDLLNHIRPDMARHIAGSTDSEWIYALILSLLDDPHASPDGEELLSAVRRALAIMRDIRAKHGITISSSVNLFITTGEKVLGVRYCFDFGCYPSERPEQVHEANLSYLSLWYTTGRDFGFYDGEWKMIGGEETADSLLIASEPLTHDTAAWLEVPEYCAVFGSLRGDQPAIEVHPLNL
jgi:glutamine amidotransferase